MIHAYDEMYLEGAMLRLGDMLEYSCLDCGYDPDAFWKMFIHSGIARKFADGNVAYLAGKSGPEIAYVILELEEQKNAFPTPTWREERSDLFWCGWILAYYQWYTNQSFEQIWRDISIRNLQKMYVTLHEADINKAVDIMQKLQQPVQQQKIADLRKIQGLTQHQLANRAHMSVSQLQRLEYGERKVENLSLKTALNLAAALKVDVRELG